MKPINTGGHSAYQDRVLTQLRKYYPDADSSIDSATWDIMERVWNLDLSHVDQLMQDRYSKYGPPPRLPSDLLRSYLLSLMFKVTSITLWASQLKQNHLYAILSGFTVGDTPGIGTFYDFFDRCWDSDKNNISNPVHTPQRRNQQSQRRRAKKLRLLRRLPFMSCLKNSRLPRLRTSLRQNGSLAFSKLYSLTSLSRWAWSILKTLPSPEMELLFIPVQGNASPVPVTASKMVFMTVSVTVSIISRTVTMVGIPIGTAIISGMTSTCLRPLTRKTISPFFLFLVLLRVMILTDSCMPGSRCSNFSRKQMLQSSFWTLPMMPWPYMNTARNSGSNPSLTSTAKVASHQFTKTTSQSTMMVSQSAGKASGCGGTEPNRRRDVRNSNAPR